MKNAFWKQYLPKWLVLFFILALAARFPYFIEKFFSRGLYVIFRNIDLFFLRWVPFSAGDVLYFLFPFWWLYKLWRLPGWQARLKFSEKILWNAVWIFYLSWGLNYFRIPVHEKQNLDLSPPVSDELLLLTRQITDSINTLHLALADGPAATVPSRPDDSIRQAAARLYYRQCVVYPELYQPYYVLKPSLFSRAVSYAQISGYFNPFTHEAQYNRLYPALFRSHIFLHELAHQTGIAYENEAEYTAWQIAVENGDAYFRYSAYLNALEYLLQFWHHKNPAVETYFVESLHPGIILTLNEAEQFRQRYALETDLLRPYDYFLKINQQGKGTESYGELILYILAYYRKKS